MSLWVQKADDGLGDANRTTVAITLGAAPTVGNILLAFISTGDFPAPGTVTKPDSNWTLVDEGNRGFCGMHLYTRVVQVGDGTGPYTWSMSVNNNHHGAIYEVAGIDTAAIVDAYAFNNNGGSPLTLALSATPTVEGTYAFAGYSNDSGGISGSVSSGWTLDVNQAVGHPADTASRDAVTSGLGAVSVTFTQGFANDCIGVAVLLKPASSATAALTGTGAAGMTEAEVVAGGKTLIITLTGAQFVP